VSLALLSAVPVAHAEPGRVWIEAGDLPWPKRALSVEVVAHDEPLFTEPNASAQRRGTAAERARLPVFAAVRRPGCNGRWLLVGALAWLCEDRVEPSALAPTPARSERDGSSLPYAYYFVGQRGTQGYASLDIAEEGSPDAAFEPGFAVAVVTTGDKHGEAYALTTKGLWLPLRDLTPARPSPFRGVMNPGSLTSLGWVLDDAPPLHSAPAGARHRSPPLTLKRLDRVEVLEHVTRFGQGWSRVGENAWVADRFLRRPAPAPLPEDLGRHEHFIDVDLASQTLLAYAGTAPVFATLVSTGRGRPGSEEATPRGEFRIWVKLRSTNMDNLEDDEASRFYSIEDVPWVMFFSRGYGLHGTFWHSGFGRVRSHGCVNLSPADAEFLFRFAGPRVPTGWTAAFPSVYEPGTRIRIR
jgi:hypothetical protein